MNKYIEPWLFNLVLGPARRFNLAGRRGGSLLISLHKQEARYVPEIGKANHSFAALWRRKRSGDFSEQDSLRYGSGFELTGITES